MGRPVNTTCVGCEAYKCHYPESKLSAPGSCPRGRYAKVIKETVEKSRGDAEILRVNIACEEVLKRGSDSQGYQWTRIRELIEYARVLRYKKIGIAGCVGLMEESKLLARILTEAEILMVQFILHSSPVFDFYLNLKSSL